MFFPSLFWSFLCLHVCMFACACPPQDSFLQVPPSGGTLSVSHRHTYPLNPPPPRSRPLPRSNQPLTRKQTKVSSTQGATHSTTLQKFFFLFWRTILSELNRCCLMAGCLGRQVSPSCPTPPRAMGCNRNRPDMNTTTVGGRGGTRGLCIPVVIAPSRRARRGGGGGWEMDIRDPPWAQANFPPP